MNSRTVAETSAERSIDVVLQSVLDIFASEDGKSFKEKKEMAINLLRSAGAAEDLVTEEHSAVRTKNAFWSSGETICADMGVTLRKVCEADRDGFIALQRVYSLTKSMLKNEAYCDIVWEEHLDNKALMFSIVQNDAYLGYCGIKDLTQTPWEIVIELQPEKTKQGIGYAAVTAMLDSMRNRLGACQYRIRIEPTNYASQRLFEKLGAEPNGLSELWIHDTQTLKDIEEDNLHLIDDNLISVARKFSVEPRLLLSHVLEYSLL